MKHRIITLVALIVFSMSIGLYSQDKKFTLELEALEVENLGGIQSFAFGQHEGKWLIIGGRLDGLHRRQPWASFDVAGQNAHLLVIDPLSQQSWKASLEDISMPIVEQMSSTNMEFYQEGEMLYIIGGYGYSATIDDHITYNKIIVLNLPEIINAILEDRSFASYIRQYEDDQFAVTGGRLEKMHDTYYLVGGQKFTGRYNPMGPDHGPGFSQEYTNQIRRFKLQDNGENLQIEHLPVWTDTVNLHRRDYNVVPQIFENGKFGLTAFSGVFKKEADLPYLNSVNIDSSGFTLNSTFTQLYNHYHCANVALHSSETGDMHTIFFGGMAQFYEKDGLVVEDVNVPFVNTIALVTRDKDGSMTETKLGIEMPGFLGAGSEFIPNLAISRFDNHVIKLDDISADNVLLGYIFGGINSTAANIFFINNGTQSQATNTIYKVILKEKDIIDQSISLSLEKQFKGLSIHPNPARDTFKVNFELLEATNLIIKITDLEGRIISTKSYEDLNKGLHSFEHSLSKGKEGLYMVVLESSLGVISRPVLINR